MAVHEWAHLSALLYLKIPVKEIVLQAMGIKIKLKDDVFVSYKDEVLYSLSGPLGSVILAILCYLLYLAFNIYWFKEISYFSFVIFVVNILPIMPMDGGRALYSFLNGRLLPKKSDLIITMVSVIFLVPMFLSGIYLFKNSGYNATLLVMSVYLFLYLMFKDKLSFIT